MIKFYEPVKINKSDTIHQVIKKINIIKVIKVIIQLVYIPKKTR